MSATARVLTLPATTEPPGADPTREGTSGANPARKEASGTDPTRNEASGTESAPEALDGAEKKLEREASGTESAPEALDAAERELEEESAERDNAVSRTVGEFVALTRAMDEVRAVLRAHGVPLRVTAILVELGLQKQPEKQSEAMDGALEQVERSHGAGTLARETLEARVLDIVRLEQDMAHARELARGLGLDARSLALLSQLVQSNPGDGGERAVNQMLAYARACGIALDDVPELAAELSAPSASVLPRIAREAREADDPARSRRALFRDVAIGLLIGTVVIGLLV